MGIHFSSGQPTLEQILERITPNNGGDKDIDSDTLEQQEKKYKNDRYKQGTAHMDKLVLWTMRIVSSWLVGVFIILLLNGNTIDISFMHKVFIGPHLSDSVLITILATTTINILGLAIIVLNGYFGTSLFSKDK